MRNKTVDESIVSAARLVGRGLARAGSAVKKFDKALSTSPAAREAAKKATDFSKVRTKLNAAKIASTPAVKSTVKPGSKLAKVRGTPLNPTFKPNRFERTGESIGRKVARGTYKAAKFVGANLAIGGAIEGGISGVEKLAGRKKVPNVPNAPDQQNLRHAARSAALLHRSGIAEALDLEQPPAVLVLKRKSIRLYPNGEKIALYRNEKLGVSFAVPYNDKLDGVSSSEKVVGSVSEEILSETPVGKARRKGGAKKQGIWSKFKGLLSNVRDSIKGRSPEEIYHQADQAYYWHSANYKHAKMKRDAKGMADHDAGMKHWDKVRKQAIHYMNTRARTREKIGGSTKAATAKALGLTAGHALIAGYLTNKAVEKIRARIERPNKKSHGGSYVYEANGDAPNVLVRLPKMRRTPLKSFVKGGAIIGGTLGLVGAAARMGYDVATETPPGAKRKPRKNKLVVQEARARRPGSAKPSEKSVKDFTPRGYHRGRAKAGFEKFIGKAGDKVGRMYKKAYIHSKYRIRHVPGNPAFVTAHRRRLLPMVARGAFWGALGGGATIYAINKSKIEPKRSKPVAEAITPKLLKRAFTGAATNKTVRLAAGDIALKGATHKLRKDGATAVHDEEQQKKVMEESSAGSKKKRAPTKKKKVTRKSSKMKRVTADLKKRFVPANIGKEIVKGGAIAVGSAIATKGLDLWYDKYHDRKKKKKKINDRRKVVEHADGNMTEIVPELDTILQTLYDNLNDENRDTMLHLITESRDGLEKVTEFALKHRG